ncbi:MAG: hypothetical protein KKD77_20470, partial [Gammaproteobacteria bacterium]|nr:hypothetical protein [Gammaproteobacteria bacterium]
VKMLWYPVRDGDPRAVALYRRHYSCRDPKVDLCRYGFSGKGESMVLLTLDCLALFCWRLVKGEGVNCSVFHNESSLLSSELVKEADELAYVRWPGERHYTYVNSKKIRSTNPGACFMFAGWRKCGVSKGGLIILEKCY